MDHIDVFQPRFSPVVSSTPYRYSVGAYFDKKRVIIAWFLDEQAARNFCRRCRADRPHINFDYLQSLF